MRDVQVVTCFLLRRGEGGPSASSGQAEVLLLRRSERVATYRGRWAGVSGYLEAGTPLEQAYREIEEEVGLERADVRLLAQGEPFTVPDEAIDRRWMVHPFLLEVLRPEHVRLDWEHTESRWVKPEELAAVPAIGPKIAESVRAYFRGKRQRKVIGKLKRAGVNMKQERAAPAEGPLAGQTFVVTGTLTSMARSEAEAKLKALGADIGSSVTKKTAYLVTGEGPGSKLQKAQQYGTKLMDEQELRRLLRSPR
ncbi:hypothetical protein LCGC14_2174360 [marine sediment metagenome]|uniref:Nudix hydrolase domain-containing protein n=1 Tax=marine sediment metagenome TaxID=412755 RepID=A0A0F9GJY5_9ZZZZ